MSQYTSEGRLQKYPSLFLLLPVIAGIASVDRFAVDPWLLLLLMFAAVFAGIYAYHRQRRLAAAMLFALAVGAFAGFQYSARYVHVGPRHIRHIVDEMPRAEIFGEVSDWPDLRTNRTEITVSLDSLGEPLNRRAEGAILLKVTDTTTALQRGDRVVFTARLYPLPPPGKRGGFDYNRFLRLHGIDGLAYLPTLLEVKVKRRPRLSFLGFVDGLRSEILETFERDLSPEAAALASGFLIGETRNIPPDIYERFRDSGTLHLLAVSGSNVALVLLFVILVLKPFRPSGLTRSLILLAVILVFAALSYGEPSVLRASLMAALVIVARGLQRKVDLNNIISLAALIILLWDPAQLFDIGFQLSFVTAWGLVFVTPKLARPLERYHTKRWYRWLYLPFMVALVAQLCSTPLIALYFGRVPMYSVVANIVIVPLVSAAVMGILAVLVAHLILPLFGLFVGGLVSRLLDGILWLLDLFGGEGTVVFDLAPYTDSGMLIFTALLAYGVVLVGSLALQQRRYRRALLFVLLVGINGLLLTAVVSAGQDEPPRAVIESVPGGLAVAVVYDGTADIVVTGLYDREYDTGEKILQPWLRDMGMDSLKSISVLSSHHGALRDLILLSQRWGATLYLEPALRASFEDAARSLGRDSTEITVYFPDSAPIRADKPGLQWTTGGVCLVTAGRVLVMTDRVREVHFAESLPQGSGILCVGESWYASAENLSQLQRSGYNRIICSKIAQRYGESVHDIDWQPEPAPEEFVTQIRQAGMITLPLDLLHTSN